MVGEKRKKEEEQTVGEGLPAMDEHRFDVLLLWELEVLLPRFVRDDLRDYLHPL